MFSWRAVDTSAFLRWAEPARKRARAALSLAGATGAAIASGWLFWPRGATDVPVYEVRPLSLGVVDRTISSTGEGVCHRRRRIAALGLDLGDGGRFQRPGQSWRFARGHRPSALCGETRLR